MLALLQRSQCRVRQCQVESPSLALSPRSKRASANPERDLRQGMALAHGTALDPKRLLPVKYELSLARTGVCPLPGLATAKWMSCLIAMVSPRFRSWLIFSNGGDAGRIRRDAAIVRRIHSGWFFTTRLEEPAMFRLPAYDPVGIAMLGFGIVAVAALATFATDVLAGPQRKRKAFQGERPCSSRWIFGVKRAYVLVWPRSAMTVVWPSA